jgi:hypothetical protein
MGIKVSRLSHTTGQWRPWGGGKVEVSGTASGVLVEFTRRVGRGSSTFQIQFDDESFNEIIAAMKTSRKFAKERRAALHSAEA